MAASTLIGAAFLPIAFARPPHYNSPLPQSFSGSPKR